MEVVTTRKSLVRAVLFFVIALAVVAASIPSALFAASNYGAGTYGGGGYGQGETPVVTPAASSGGNGQIVGSSPTAPSGSGSAFVIVPVATTTGSTSVEISKHQFVLDASSTPAVSYQFTHSLQFRERDLDVRRLQQFLNTHGSVLTSEGDGSPGNETDFFGVLTYRALVQFQNAHPDEILKPSGLTVGSGYFGPNTRAYLATLPD